MHSSHQAKLLKAGYTIYTGTTSPQGLVIKAKTLDNSNWHTIETGFETKSQLKKRLFEIDKKSAWIDLYDSKNNLTDNEAIQIKEKAEKWDSLRNKISTYYFDENGDEHPQDKYDLGDIGEAAASYLGFL